MAMKCSPLILFSCFLIESVQPTFVENQYKNAEVNTLELRNATKEKNETNLAIMVSQLTNLVTNQEKAMAMYHEKIIKILKKQTEMLSLLSKKRKQPNKSTKPPSYQPITTSLPNTTPAPNTKLLSEVSGNWSYSGFSEWSVSHPSCKVEESQSPINLETVDVAVRDHKTPLMFSYYDKLNRDTCKLVNTGNTATLRLSNTLSPQPTMSGGPFNSTEYHFSQAVFHWGSNDTLGSEHTIRTTNFPMEMQLIHLTSSQDDTKLAIASFVFEISKHDNLFLAPIIDTLASIKVAGSEEELNAVIIAAKNATALAINEEDTETASVKPETFESFSMKHLIQDSIYGPYFTYSGSLTYPPCTLVKTFVVFRMPLDISTTQLEKFRSIQQQDGSSMVNNFRPVQPLGRRILAFTM